MAFAGASDYGFYRDDATVRLSVGDYCSVYWTDSLQVSRVSIIPAGPNTYDLGQTDYRWRDFRISGQYDHVQAVQDAATPTGFTFTGGAHTACITTAEVIDVLFDLSRDIAWAEGNITNQRSIKILAPTIEITGAGGTVTTASTV